MANETMVLLEKIVVPSAGAASIEFTSIPQTYTDLCIVLSLRSARSDTDDTVALEFNSSSANLSMRRILGNGSSASSASTSTIPIRLVADTATASTFGNTCIYIPNYAGSNYKSVSIDNVTEANATLAFTELIAGLWSSSSAITSIKLTSQNAANVKQYSSAYLYGIAKQGVTPTNAPAATGGDSIVFDGTYWIHTFYSSGTFTPKKNLTCDYLVVAGGGGGGRGYGGGGGAGGYRYLTNQSVSFNTSYTVTVGAGGNGSTSTTANGSNGSNSVFGSTTSSGGGGGASNNTSPNANGNSGGSGGGAAGTGGGPCTGGAGNAGSYSPVEGYAGGNSVADAPNYGSGGGGGSSAVGANGTSTTSGNGGAGTANSITGSSVTYAGGGGAGIYAGNNRGTGGAGGGGNGGGDSGTNPTAGTANLGGGGGGGGNHATNTNGANGGSGIVIVRYAA